MSRIVAILPAAGLGTRMGAETPKQFLELDGMPLVIFTLRRLAACEAITEFVIATLTEEVAVLRERIQKEKLGRPVRVVRGGGNRQESVGNALAEAPADAELVLVHDAVRPLVTREQVARVIAVARERGAAIRNPRRGAGRDGARLPVPPGEHRGELAQRLQRRVRTRMFIGVHRYRASLGTRDGDRRNFVAEAP